MVVILQIPFLHQQQSKALLIINQSNLENPFHKVSIFIDQNQTGFFQSQETLNKNKTLVTFLDFYFREQTQRNLKENPKTHRECLKDTQPRNIYLQNLCGANL